MAFSTFAQVSGGETGWRETYCMARRLTTPAPYLAPTQNVGSGQVWSEVGQDRGTGSIEPTEPHRVRQSACLMGAL